MKTYRATILGLCVALLMIIGLAAPAQALASDCQSNETCVFLGTSYGRPHYDYNRQTHGCVNFGGSYVNNIGSIVNNTNRQVWFFTGTNCFTGGSSWFDGVDPYTKVTLGSPWLDNFESAYFEQ